MSSNAPDADNCGVDNRGVDNRRIEGRDVGHRNVDHRWERDELPANVDVGPDVVITGAKAFSRFFGQRPQSLTIGARSVMDGVRFSVGRDGRLTIGRDCRLSEAVVLAESSVEIGDRVMIGWNATIADADFHPVDPAARRIDAEAISPVDNGLDRPWVGAQPVTIGDDTWIGPNVAILKGVRIGADCFIEPGSVVVGDVPARSRVLGNPAVVVESWGVER